MISNSKQMSLINIRIKNDALNIKIQEIHFTATLFNDININERESNIELGLENSPARAFDKQPYPEGFRHKSYLRICHCFLLKEQCELRVKISR